MRRLWLNRSVPAKKSGQNIPKNRCRTTIAERVVETRAELPFIGDQVGLSRTQPGRPKRQTFPTLGVDRPMFLQRDLAVHVPNLPIQLPAVASPRQLGGNLAHRGFDHFALGRHRKTPSSWAWNLGFPTPAVKFRGESLSRPA